VRPDAQTLLSDCHFPAPGTAVDLAVSGGPDSLGLLLLALSADLIVTVHHVDHHARPTSGRDAKKVERTCRDLDVAFVRHDVTVEPGGNFESRARSARRGAMPAGVMTGHTMDDLAETVLLNMLRGAGLDGMSPMVDDPTKPLRGVRRLDLVGLVVDQHELDLQLLVAHLHRGEHGVGELDALDLHGAAGGVGAGHGLEHAELHDRGLGGLLLAAGEGCESNHRGDSDVPVHV
jgi:hypothetical protein